MQFELVVDAKALAEAGKMGRRWYYWPRVILRGGYFWLFLSVLVYGLFFNLISPGGSLQRAGVCGVVSAAMISIFVWQTKRNSGKVKSYLDGINPIRFNVQPDGVSMTEKAGTNVFTPWGGFASFREGERIFLLNRVGSDVSQIIPKDGLPTHDVDSLRSQFVASIPAVIK